MVKKLLTISEAEEYLNSLGYPIKKAALYKLTSTGNIPFVRFGVRKILFRPEQIEAWAEGQIRDPGAETKAMEKKVAENARKKERRA